MVFLVDKTCTKIVFLPLGTIRDLLPYNSSGTYDTNLSLHSSGEILSTK